MSFYTQEITDLDAAPANRQAQADETMTPLAVRLRAVLDEIPLATRREGLTLESIRARLKGRTRGAAHTGELGAALVRLGYTRRRDWRQETGTGYGARWYPPGYAPGGAQMSHRVIHRLRDARPDLFPGAGQRSTRALRAARKRAAEELGLI